MLKIFNMMLATAFTLLVISCSEYTPTDTIPNDPSVLTIGKQVWMTKNLDVATYRNGEPILHCQTDAEWNDANYEEKGAWCYYNNSDSLGKIYGKLYNWYAVNDPRGLAPEGWHIPTDREWITLEKRLGMRWNSAEKYGSRGTDQGSQLAGRKDLWANGELSNKQSFGLSGFLAIPAGVGFFDGYVVIPYSSVNIQTNWWTATDVDDNNAINRSVSIYKAAISRSSTYKSNRFSVRCIKD